MTLNYAKVINNNNSNNELLLAKSATTKRWLTMNNKVSNIYIHIPSDKNQFTFYLSSIEMHFFYKIVHVTKPKCQARNNEL